MPIDHPTLVRHLLADRAKLIGYIWVIVRDEHAAEDIFQDVSLLAIEKRDAINDADHLHAWLRAAARNKALHWLRAQRNAPVQLDADVLAMMDSHFARHDALKSSDVADALSHCREQLSPYARRLIEARYRDDLTGQQLADHMDRAVNTVYQALSRAHAALADCVQQQLSDSPPDGGTRG